jgi:hypothetical protein
MRQPLLVILCLAPLFSSCVAAAAGVGAGVLISQEGTDNSTYVAQLQHDAKVTWSTVKTTLSDSSLKPIDTQEEARTATAEVDGAKVKVVVETLDLGKSVVKVSARKYGFNNGEIARIVLDRIVFALDR